MAVKKQSQESTGVNSKVIAASIVGIIAVIAVVAFVSTTGFFTVPAGSDQVPNDPVSTPVQPSEITTFIDSGDKVELIDGKPVIRLFSTTWCSHCKWVGPMYERVAREYVDAGKIVAYHWEVDIQDDTLTPVPEGGIPDSEIQVFKKFNPQGSIPTFIFGGKYFRVGNGHERQNDLVAEEAEFRAVIEALIQQATE